MLNGDHVLNMYVKKNGLRGYGDDRVRPDYREVAEKGTRVKGAGPGN